jgi:transcriptional regulator with XRE-family HTH domain
MHIEYKIREVRRSKNITLQKLSEMTKISKSHLCNIERGEKEPTLSILIRIALALKVDEKELYKIYP